jgi:hypothetical protein
VPALDLVVMINSGHYRDGLQSVIPAGIFNRIVLPAVKDQSGAACCMQCCQRRERFPPFPPFPVVPP